MESLENQIREYLINQRAEEIYQICKDPRYQSIRQDLVNELKVTLSSSITFDEPDEESKKLESMANYQIDAMLEPEQLRLASYKSARLYHMTREKCDSILEIVYEAIQEVKKRDETLEEFKESYHQLYEFIDYQNKIILGLVGIAKNEGIEKAKTEKAKYEAIRKICPTPIEYIPNQIKSLEMLTKLHDDQKQLGKEDFDEKELDKLSIHMEKLKKLFIELEEKNIYKEAQKIYPNSQ